MSPPRIAAVLHGARWPAGDAGAAWRERLARALQREVEIVLARDEPGAPRGAAACISEALGRTLAPVVLVCDVHASPEDETVRQLLDAVTPGGAALAVPETGTALDAHDPPLWAAQREAVIDVGGLDTALWSIGVAADLAARLRHAGAAVVTLSLAPIPVTDDAYPYASAFEAFMRWRNRLRLAFAHAPPDALGDALAAPLVALLAEAWRATGLDAGAVTFGGDWGRAPLVTRVRTRYGGPPPDRLWPADEVGTAVPLAALQAFALDLPALTRDRDARGLRFARPAAPPAHEPSTPASGLPVARPRVSVIVVNWNGREHLEPCFASLRASDYPADLLELICVDNGSTDDSTALLAARFPEVRVVALPENRGFTGGNAAGVEAATGQVFVFVNNDMKFEPTFVSRLVAALDDDAACAGARVMNWNGTRIDFVRGTASFEARGFQEMFGEPYVEGMALAESFFPNGGAFAVTRRAYEEAGGFDPALFAYYDDLDLGWRLRMAGHGIRTVPGAVAYHRHSATTATQPHAHKRFLMARNALRTSVRNYDDDTLPHVLPAILLLQGLRVAQDLAWLRTPVHSMLRSWLEPSRRHAVSTSVYDLNRPASGTRNPVPGTRILSHIAMPEWAAIGSTLEDLPRLRALHDEQQRRRRVPDSDVLPFLGRPFQELDGRRTYRDAQKALVEALGLRARLGLRPHVLLVTHEALRTNMSGPAIRVLEMARALSRTVRVTVCAPGPLDVRDDRVALVPFDPSRPAALRAQAETADAVIVQGFALTTYPFLRTLVCPIVADLYCPFTIEHLEQARAGGRGSEAGIEHEAASILAVQNAQLQQADYFICASERQRDFWIGALHTAGRVNPRTVGRDADLRTLVDVVPFGLPSDPIEGAARRAQESRAARGRPVRVMKGVHPSIRATDRVLLWGGSLLDWQDPETLIRAVAELTRTRDDVKLFFMGVKHPNPQVKPMAIVARARALAESLGIADTHVVFNDWVPYDERALYLTEADIGISTHGWHLETRYAFRTRMLDYLWARLPIVCSEGDFFGDLVRTHGLGRAVPPGDVRALAAAIEELLESDTARRDAAAALAQVADTMTWDRVVAPLRAWCADPQFAADREHEVAAFRAHLDGSYRTSRWLKRAALGIGVKEGDVEAFKQWGPVRAGMSVRNAIAIRRARRKARSS